MIKDVRYALRLLVRSPGYSLVVILVLALGIGVNVLVFALFKALALTPLAGVDDSASLHVVVSRTRDGRETALSYPDYRYVRDHDRSHQGLAGSLMQGYSLGRGIQARLIYGELVTGNFFQVLGVRPQRGRTIAPADDVTPLGHPVAVISDNLWRQAFGADPAIVGKAIELNRRQLTVIGVAEPAFRGSVAGLATEIFIPVAMQPWFSGSNALEDRTVPLLFVMGRPKPGVSLAGARAEMSVLASHLRSEFPVDDIEQRASVLPMWQSPYGTQTYMLPAISVMGGTSMLLLVSICANIAGLVLVRGLSRRREIVARLALGATRARISRLLVTESLLLAAPGACLGLQLPRLLAPLLEGAQSNVSLPLFFNVEGGVVTLFAAVAATASAIAFSLGPGLAASHVDLVAAIKDDAVNTRGHQSRLRTLLVVAQVAMCVILLAGTGLAVRSLQAARRAEAGFEAADVVSVALDVSQNGRDTGAGLAFYDELLDGLRADPRVTAASVAKGTPLAVLDFDRMEVVPEGYHRQPDDDLRVAFNLVGPDYFRALRIPMAAGREFERRDQPSGSRSVIVNETMARRFWGSPAAAVGKRLQAPAWSSAAATRTLEIVGVARDIKYVLLNERPRPFVYLPFSESYYNPTMFLQVRGRPGTNRLVDLVKDQIRARDPQQAIIMAGTLTEQTSMSRAVYDLTARALGIVGAIAMGLAALGIYGMVAFTAKQRTRDIGIRMAVGAPRGHILRRFLLDGLRIGGVGAIAGAALALAAARLMTSLLFGVSTLDPVSFLAAIAAAIGIAAAAAFVPAWRASRSNPLIALRHQ